MTDLSLSPGERGSCKTNLLVRKYDPDQASWAQLRFDRPDPQENNMVAAGMRPSEELYHEDCNLITDAGWNLLMKNVAGSAGTLFSASVGRISAGSSSNLVTYSDTDLNGPSKYYKLISAAPTVGSTHSTGLTFIATFGTAQANFNWQEFGTDQGTADGTIVQSVFFNHGLANNGTKIVGSIWSVTEIITWI